MTHRWANTKKKCNDRSSVGTGLEAHFKSGCPCDTGAEKSQIRITLLEHMTMTHEELIQQNHRDSPGCRCNLCGKLKSLEDKWICRIGTMHKPHGLNTRDEIISKSRCTFQRCSLILRNTFHTICWRIPLCQFIVLLCFTQVQLCGYTKLCTLSLSSCNVT